MCKRQFAPPREDKLSWSRTLLCKCGGCQYHAWMIETTMCRVSPHAFDHGTLKQNIPLILRCFPDNEG